MADVIPAILAKSYEELERMVRTVEPYVERVHLDIMDGVFVSNTTITGYDELIRLDTNLKFDVHLMVENPADLMYHWYEVRGKADTFLVHAERANGLRELLEQIRLNQCRAGLVLNPETAVEEVQELLELIDMMQFMTVHPGFYGGQFIDDVLGKITDFRESHPDRPILVDGGITPETAIKTLRAGATTLVSGSYIFNSPDPAKAILELKNI